MQKKGDILKQRNVIQQIRVKDFLKRKGVCVASQTRLSAAKPPPIFKDLDVRNFENSERAPDLHCMYVDTQQTVVPPSSSPTPLTYG